ncbi:MAG: CHAT domain-containing protein [Rubrivivax sp.]|nr:CHAT domain-containing protein [Rubrivivax sp.]
MTPDIQVRTVRVEFLRAGPAHNQLLSPLTPYLAVCDDAEAGVVNVPFEQHTFERRMRAMRHQDQAADAGDRPAPKDRLPSLRELGVAMARLLGSVPRFPGSLGADPNGRDTVVRVSLTLTASELAALPFELAKVPIGPDACSENWLSVQSKVPVVITRRTRNVSITRMQWLATPRVLFISAGQDHGEVPFQEHLNALVEAVRPFALGSRFGQKAKLQNLPDKDGINVRKTFGDTLTVLSNATLDGVVRECSRQAYTHVHILGHGDRDDDLGDSTYGLRLHPDDGLITGERLASALTTMVDGGLHRPQVVTLATCDSANTSDVVNPGASLAHALHQAGIALVVASQVPLGFQGSVLFAETFYGGLLWGEHPWVLMHRVRTTLHSRLKPVEHDWASLVVYECLPTEMGDALERATYQQCRRAVEVAYASGRWVGSDALDKAIERLAATGQRYGMEARALRADTRMINARDEAFDLALNPGTRSQAELRESLRYQRWCMDEALADYQAAVDGFLVNAGQGLRAPFRQLLARFSIQIVLGKPLDWGDWHAARIWAETLMVHPKAAPEDQGWAQACLAELWLLKVLDVTDNVRHCLLRATEALRATVQVRQPRDGFSESPVYWMEYRLFGYLDAWGNPQLREGSLLGTDAAPGTEAPLDMTPVVDGARRLLTQLHRLDSSMGLQDAAPATPAMAAAAAMAPSRGMAGTDAHHLAAPSAAGAEPEAMQESVTSSAAVPLSYAQAMAPSAATSLLRVTPANSSAATATQSLLQAVTGRAGQAAGAARPPAPATHAATRAATTSGAAKPRPTPKPTPPGPAAAGPATHLSLELLPAEQGDCLWLEWGLRDGPRHRLLMDCGTEGSFKRSLGPRLQALPPGQRHLELFILSHIDGDHIGGGIALLQQAKALGLTFGDIWFNGRHHLEQRALLSGKDGDDFSTLLQREQLPWNGWSRGGPIVRPAQASAGLPTIPLAGGLTLTLLSPTPQTLVQLAGTWDADLAKPGKRRLLSGRKADPETDLDTLAKRRFDADDSRPNGSSIAVLAEFAGQRLLLASDAYADVLAQAIRALLPTGQARLRLDAFKLSHHGSRRNVNDELMALIDCPHYLISTSGAVFSHPDREALARVVRRSHAPAQLWFNHPLPERNRAYHAIWQDRSFQQRWGFQAHYPADSSAGLRLQWAGDGQASLSPAAVPATA